MEVEQKEHKIQTVQDMVDVVTHANLDCLLGDLRNHLVMAMTARETGLFYNPRPGVMRWIDSGRCDVFLNAASQLADDSVAQSLEPAVQDFNATMSHAMQRLIKESLVANGNETSVVHAERHANQEAWVSSEEEST